MTVTSNATQGTWARLETTAIASATLEQKALVNEHQIPLTVGDKLAIKEVSLRQSWYRGTNLSSGLTGIFPMSYALVKRSEGENFDVAINELATVIREWGGILKTYYKEKRMQDYRVMKERLFELMQWHTHIFSPKSTVETREPLKKKVLDKIQEGRLLMGLDMVVRTATGDVADETNTGVIPLYRMHQELANSTTTERTIDHAQPQPLSPGAPRKKDDTLTHLFLDFKIFMCSVGETTELYFSLYNKPESRFVSDEYQIVLTAQGMPTDIDKMGKLSTIFTDLSKKELTGLYLVCRLVRKGKMLADQKETKKEKLSVPVRRPFGCAVLNLEGNVRVHDIGTKHKLNEHTMPIYATNQESLFPTLHELIIKGQFNSIQEVPKAKGVCIGLAFYTGEYQQLAKEPSLTSVWPTGKLGMPDIILPGYARNDMFVVVESGEFLKDRKTAQKNVEVLMQLVLENGEIVNDAIFTGSDKSKQEYRSMVYYHSNQPHWNETVRVSLPPAVKLYQAYLVFYSRHLSTTEGKDKPPNCVSYLKLTNPDGTIIADETHNLLSYKPGKSMEEPIPNLKDPGMAKLLRQGEVLRVRTVLCSTMCTQNIALLSLLKWESYTEDLGELMNRFTFVSQGEIIKFIQEIYDSMFAILDSNKITNHESVYHAIVKTTSLLVDERTSYTNFRPVLDMYILNHLKSVRAHTHLISCLKAIFANMQTQSSKALMPTLKSLEYIIKFIVVSWLNYQNTNPQDNTQHQADFKNEIMSVLTQINALMQKPDEFIGAQTIALKNFMSIFNDLEKIFVVAERAKIAIDFIDSVKFGESRRLLNLEKLLLILNLVESELFLRDDVRGIMLPTLVRNLKQHLGGAVQEDVLKCGTILMKVIESLQARLKDKTAPATLLSSQIGQLTGVLPEAMACIKTLGRTSRARLDLIHSVFSIFYLMEPSHFESFLKDEKGIPRKQYLLSTFDILQNILSNGSAYPENWFTMMLFQYSVIRKVILEMSRQVILRAKQVGKSAPHKPKLSTNLAKVNASTLELQTWSNTHIGQEYDIWVSYLKLCIEFSKSKGLALENFSENKQRALKSRNGDIRTDVIQALKSMWDALGQHQVHLLDDAVGPFLELVTINQPTIRATSLSLYVSLLRSEFNDTKALVAMEKATINTLDRLLNDSAAPPSIVDNYRAYFSQTLPGQFTSSDALSVRAQKFFKDTSMFLDLLYELRTLPNTIEYEDDRTVATMKLMAYLKQSDRRDTYVKYVHKLSNQHLSSNLFIEAGLTILLHADLLEWSDDIVDELPGIGYPSETQRERKERLFKYAIEYLDKGKAWEKAIHLLGQLRELYENTLFDYQKLADTLQTESAFYRKIVGVDRFFAEYFRVGYYGKGFESSIQNKEFIYRGFELEHMSDFIQRVQAKFPDAKQLNYTEYPPPEILNGNGQWLQIFAVKPYCEEIEKTKRTVPLPPAITKYKQSNDVQVFLYSKPVRKIKTANEFADLWLTNVYYYTEDRFPTTHRRSEIIKKTVAELPPIENAYNAVRNKNTELVEFTQKYERGTEQNINPFTMVLKGVIDAAVNGGVKRYQEAFYTPEYIADNPTHGQRIDDLKQSLFDQVNILQTALAVLSKICPPEMTGLLEQLESLLDEMAVKMGMKPTHGKRKSVNMTPNAAAPTTPVLSRSGTTSAPTTPVLGRRNHD